MTSLADPALPDWTPLGELDDAWRAASAGLRLDEIRRSAPRLRDRIAESGRALCVRTFDLTQLPYPTRFGLGGAATSPVPYLVMTHRATLVQYETLAGEPRTLLFNPTDTRRSAETPFFAGIRRKMGSALADWVEKRITRPKPHEQLASAGIDPAVVDWIAFDHLHTQDLRDVLGASGRPADLPRARLLVHPAELAIFDRLHPLQRHWYIEEGLAGIDSRRIVPVDRDILLGKGVALVRTPGHTVGNWSLVVSTERGVWAISENGVGCDNYAPEASRIPGVARYARRTGEEVVLNANTLEGRNEQYTSMVLEKLLVDRVPDAPEFFQHFASSELTATPFTPGLSPTWSHGKLETGTLRTGWRASARAQRSVEALS